MFARSPCMMDVNVWIALCLMMPCESSSTCLPSLQTTLCLLLLILLPALRFDFLRTYLLSTWFYTARQTGYSLRSLSRGTTDRARLSQTFGGGTLIGQDGFT